MSLNPQAAGLLRDYHFRDYQREAVEKVLRLKRLAILLKPGLGKTAVCLKVLSHLMKKYAAQPDRPQFKTLIVAPIYVCTNVWRQEAVQWDFSYSISFGLIRGTPAERMDKLKYKYDVYLINYELLGWFCDTLQKMEDPPQFNMVIFDELSKLANIKSKVHKAAAKNFNHVNWKIGLTGTPVGNSLINLFGELFCIDGGESLGDNFYTFRDDYFTNSVFRPYEWKPKKNARSDIFRAIQHRCYNYDPPNRAKPSFYHLSCNLGVRSSQLINDVAVDKVLDDMVLREPDICNKISQIESGFYYGEDYAGNPYVTEMNRTKLERTEALIESLEGESLLIFYRFKHDLDALVSIGASTKQTSGFIDKWNRDEIKLLAVHPKSLGHGVNLQHGGCNILFFGLPWSIELFDQAVGRLSRIGQKRQVNVYWFATEQEKIIFKALRERKSVENALVAFLKMKSDIAGLR